MWVYVVVFDGAYGMQIDEVFTSEHKANERAKEMNKEFSGYCFEVKKYFAV